MITINEIATELENILNGTSTNVPSGVARPFDGLFAVRTEGYVLDHVTDYQSGKNFFPVFMGQMTGEYNPIPDLEQIDMEIPVSIYFPVRFKSRMMEMQSYLVACFVGKGIGFDLVDGKYNQYAACNISVPSLGEITDLSLDEYGTSILKGLNQFISEQYKMPISSSEPWLCLTFSLYMSTMKNAMSTDEEATIYGNMYDISLVYKGKVEGITTDNVAIAYGATTESQQGFTFTGKSEKTSTAFGVTGAVSFSFEATVKRNAFWYNVMCDLLRGNMDLNNFELSIELQEKYQDKSAETDYARFDLCDGAMVVTGITTNIGVNAPLTCTFTFTFASWVQS